MAKEALASAEQLLPDRGAAVSQFNDPSNPFAAPVASSTAGATELPPGERGPMPTSVIVALVATGLMVLLSAIGSVGQLAAGEPAIGSLISVVIGILILLGIAKGHRLAHQWGRILVGIGAVLYTLGAGFGVVGVMMIANNPEILGADAPPELQNIDLRTAAMVGIAFLFGFVLLLWTIFFSLGTKSARRYFRLVCPSCGNTKVKANDFFFNRGKCKRCGVVW
ncbi:hypothetical protein [Aeoliella sp. SH292]|uniref:hypothetical protein n=1 Tax=Aeoliella sp. SH292 TaxID=3454464 RepID=UPI003F982752